MTPSPEVPATVHHGDGQVMSFWRYLSPSGRGLAGGQRGQHLRVGSGPLGPGGVPGGGAPGDVRLVDQPRPCAVVGVVGIALRGGEPGQDKGPRRGEGRVGLFQLPQALGLGRDHELGGVRSGEVTQPCADHVQRLTGTGRSGRYTHEGHLRHRA
jgi:hypothetical protein